MPDVVFEVGQRRLVRGIPSRESIEPSDPIERVRALPSEPLRALWNVSPDHEPTLIERGTDVPSNHPLTAHRNIHISRPGQG